MGTEFHVCVCVRVAYIRAQTRQCHSLLFQGDILDNIFTFRKVVLISIRRPQRHTHAFTQHITAQSSLAFQ